MTRRLIWILVAVAVLGAAGFLGYDHYLGRELRRGQELRDALATELASAGVAFTSMKYDWRTRRVVAEGLAATKLPKGVKGFSIGRAIYRGADPATWRAALAQKDEKSGELVADLTLSDIVIGFDEDVEFKQASVTLKHVSLSKAVPREGLTAKMQENPLLLGADMARRFHVGLLEAEGARFWHPKVQAVFEQKLLRLEDYRGGNFSEFRLEGLALSVAVVVRAKLDEYFAESVKARRFLENLHRSPLVEVSEELAAAIIGLGARPGGAGNEISAEPRLYGSAAETAIIGGDTALIGFEMLIPAVGRVAFEEIAGTDRQFVNGIEVGGKGKVVGVELQFNMLTQLLTAALDGADIAAVVAEAGSDVDAWLVARGGDAAGDPVLPADAGRGRPGMMAGNAPRLRSGRLLASGSAQRDESEPKEAPPPAAEDQVPTGPDDGKVEQGPAAPVPQVWGNEIKPPQPSPKTDNQEIAEFIRKLGFDNLRMDSAAETIFDEQAKTWALTNYSFNIQNFWTLGLDIRLGGVGAVEDLGDVPLNKEGWFAGPKADAVGDRFMKEGRFEGFTLTYQEQGFLPRLLALIAEQRKTTVEALVSELTEELFSEKAGAMALRAEGLDEALKAFLLAPQMLTIRFQPGEPVPFSAFPEMYTQKAAPADVAVRLGLVLTLNERTFSDFKKSAAIGSDIESEQE